MSRVMPAQCCSRQLHALLSVPCPGPQEEFEEEAELPLDVMPLNAVGHTFTILRRPAGSWALGRFANILRFKVKEIDPTSGEGEGCAGGSGLRLDSLGTRWMTACA